ncbi:hypothetical protein THIOM_000176 [Candidatus Thiomargarita nelsonii]|uniref:PIN domain-containing protein n=1 Tax=Candidatus Thiomargarita nelsonii TaxID=1003181 RepID=A0A176S7M5_9GAMM|nr:hypothetical protein THIOM_000176 [Candidatus Thiomargarita nelsonii]
MSKIKIGVELALPILQLTNRSLRKNIMLKHIYIETSIPSLYYDIRTDAETVARTHWTQQWWNIERGGYELVTSSGVIQELSQGNHPNKTKKMALINNLPLLPLNQEIAEIIEVYINQFVMPADPTGDALHLAVASYYKIDMLLTWNCQHIANANKFDHILRVNTKLGLFTPLLTTPLNLLGGIDNDKRSSD